MQYRPLKPTLKSTFKPTCREVHRLVSESLDRDLSLVDRSRVKFHLFVCEACTRFSHQMSVLRQAFRQGPPNGS